MLYSFLVAILRPIFYLLFRVEYLGTENIPDHGRYILVSNHRSGYDPVFLALGSKKRHIHFMAKEELMTTPVLGWLLRHVGCFGVDRGTGDTGAVDQAVDLIKNDEVVGIFPEGTRAPVGAVLRPKSGVAHIARMSGADILPCCVSIDGKIRFRARVKVRYGRLIPCEQLGFEGEGAASGLRTATRTMWNQGVIPLLEELEGPIEITRKRG